MLQVKKIIIVMLVISFLFFNTFSFAINPSDYDPSQGESGGNEKVSEIGGKILANIRTIGVCMSVVVLTVIGIKYMFCSVEEKASYKENIIPYVAGCFLLACATVIPSMVYNIATETSTESSSNVNQGITWNEATSAKEYIDGGGNLEEVSDEKLLDWYGQLSRLSGNSDKLTDYYEKVKKEVNNRGGYDAIK